MSASETNIEKQTKRHIGPLAGMALCATFVALLYLGYILLLAERGQEPREATEGAEGAAVTAPVTE
ncbi:hypothetical protein [Pseudaestuariivita sp.]|uniref:hypothetical protein n=1 Tax=Pseudaestuariivita sp. TaxID=2211669 RepID=UPI00405893EC